MSGTPFGDLFANERRPPEMDAYAGKRLELVVPERIKAMLPDVRLVCVLRDPIERAFSHHRMMGLERAESRPFDDAISELLEDRALERARVAPTRTNNYIVNGEYGRVLAGFLEVFPREQLLAIFSDELAEQPQKTLERLFAFVGVKPSFIPENVGTKYRTGAEKERIAGLNLYTWQASLARLRPARALWHRLPDRVRGGVDHAFTVTSYRVAMWNARRGVTGDHMSPAVRERLQAHFTPDGTLLRELLGEEVPWLAKWDDSSATRPMSAATDAHGS